MATESAVVLILILLISYIYLRRGKRGMAAGVLPLAVLPLCMLLGTLLGGYMPDWVPSAQHWRLLFIMVGLVGGGTLFGIFGAHIRKKSAQRAYLLLCGGFTILFAFAEMLKLFT